MTPATFHAKIAKGAQETFAVLAALARGRQRSAMSVTTSARGLAGLAPVIDHIR